MDNLKKQLRLDAEAIDAPVSDELDRRISASLQGITPERPVPATPAEAPQQRPLWFWLASTLTGAVAALAVIAIVNDPSPPTADIDSQVANSVPESVNDEVAAPTIDWNMRSAMLTQPLQRELEDLQSDLRRAEEKVKEDIGL